MKPIGLSLGCVLLLLAPQLRAQQCGEERVPVKVLNDADARRVDMRPLRAGVAQLVSVAPPEHEGADHNRQTSIELHTFTVDALLVGAELQEDGDYHLVLADPGEPQTTMIAEIPAPYCAGSRFADRFAAARRFIDANVFVPRREYRPLARPLAVRVTGVGFFDRWHDQHGQAPNAVELHPVLAIETR